MATHRPLNKTWIDWAFAGFLLALCATLTMLQYRWTGQIADAERARLRGDLAEQARALTAEFDTTLGGACEQLMPTPNDFSGQSLEATHLARFDTWRTTHPRPLFQRIAVALVRNDRAQLLLLDQPAGKWVQTNWPPEWSRMEEDIIDRMGGGPPPFADRSGRLVEIPVFGGTDSPWEHWLILELDMNYVRKVWLPELAARHLNTAEAPVNEVVVRTVDDEDTNIFSTGTNAAPADARVVTVRFNLGARNPRPGRGPPSNPAHWVLEAWQRPGALDAIVAASRRRNLALALFINGLLLLTGLALIRHTRRSRELTERQVHFVAGVTHELRTPLTVIRGAAHNLNRGVVTEKAQIEQYSKLIMDHCGQLTGMIEQILTYAGAQRSQGGAARQPVAVGEVLREAIAATASETAAAQCEVQLDLPPNLPPVSGDAAQLRRVFQNLISNAAKYASQGRWIGISAIFDNKGAPPMVEIQVKDRGPGIPNEERERIFTPFYRGAQTASGQTRGTGLGLSVVWEIVKGHHGTVTVRAGSEQGAAFIVRLPAASSEGVP